MENYVNRLKILSSKINKFIEKNSLLQKENVILGEEINAFKNKIDDKNKKILELEEKIKLLKLAKTISSDSTEYSEKTELKRKINEYIKEVDKCIGMLNE